MAAKTGGSNVMKAILRITIWGTIAMGLSAFVGYLFGVSLYALVLNFNETV
jgi:VIT1/CCC1 family predicted Fe2+/Mn2+ transporter